jgi:hypothetical protein
MDGAAVSCPGTATATATVTDLSPGAHTFVAFATDSFANVGPKYQLSFTQITGDGNLILIGHDYASTSLVQGQLLSTSAALGAGASYPRGLRIAIVGAAVPKLGLSPNVDPTKLANVRAGLGTYTERNLVLAPTLPALALQGMDVVVFPDQVNAGTAAATWGPALKAFVDAGGVVIVCDGTSKLGLDRTYTVLAQSSLTTATIKTVASITPVQVSRTASATMAPYVGFLYTAQPGTVDYSVSGDAALAAIYSIESTPVVLRKVFVH